MPSRRQAYGNRNESVAAEFLKSRGYIILERNYRIPAGEIDIIAVDGDVIVFVEVKARSSGRFGNPKQAVTRSKQRRISITALHYLKAARKTRSRARFDVVSIINTGEFPQIELVKNAFPLAYG